MSSPITAKTSEHRLLIGVYYIPALRNSIISLGQLDENGLRVEIEHGSCVSMIAIIAFSPR